MYKNYKLFIIIVIFLMGLYVVSCYDREPKNEKCSDRFIGGELDYDTKVSN